MEGISFLAKSMGILSLFYVVYLAVLHKNTLFTAKRHYLIAGIIAAITIPFLQWTRVLLVALPSQPEYIPTGNFTVGTSQVITPSALDFSINWWQVALVIYSVGSLLMLSRLVVQLLSLRKLIASGTVVNKTRFTYLTVGAMVSPFSFFSYIVYNPKLHTQEELHMILAHEEVHAGQWHSLDILLTHTILALQWCNPLAWLYKQSLEQNLEYIADYHAVQQLSNPKQYQRTLAKVSSPTYRPALTNQFYHSFIKKRIIMLNTPQSRKTNLWKLGIILPVLAVFMYSFNVKEVTRYMEEDTPAFAKAEIPLPIEKSFGDKANTTEAIPAEASKSKEIQNTLQAKVSKNEATPATSPKIATNIITPLIGSSTPVQTILVPKAKAYPETMSTQEEYRFTITKNTTIEELKLLQQALKKQHNATLNYSNVDYNKAGEITSIRLDFQDAQGNNKNYTVQSASPIGTIYIYRDANGRTGMGNVASGKEAMQRSQEMRERMNVRRNAMAKNRDSMRFRMHTRRDSMRSRMEGRSEDMRTRMEEARTLRGTAQKDSMRLDILTRRDGMKAQKNKRKVKRKNKKGNLQTTDTSGYITLDGDTYYYAKKKDGSTAYYNHWGVEIKEGDQHYEALKNTPIVNVQGGINTDVISRLQRYKETNTTLSKDATYYVNDTKTSYADVQKLDPENIETISVLKGKAAIKLYGKGSKNGVILIETKE